jgi:hypothetical protein
MQFFVGKDLLTQAWTWRLKAFFCSTFQAGFALRVGLNL